MAFLSRYANFELLDMPDCGGLRENGKCSWLDVSICMGAGCPYYHSLNKAHARLRSLDEKTQERISRKYYGGGRPWADGRK